MLLQKLGAHAAERGDRIAVRPYPEIIGPAMTFDALWRCANARAGQLAQVGVSPKDLVLVFDGPLLEIIPTFLGAMRLGATPSFMPLPNDRQDPIRFWTSHRELFRHLGTGVAIAPERETANIAGAAKDSHFRTVALEHLVQIGPGAAAPESLPAPDDVALLQHSSGTTGLKKGVALTYRQIDAQVDAYARRLGLDRERHRIVSWLPLYHDMGLVACLLTPLTLGLETVQLSPFRWVGRPDSLLEAVEAHRGTHVWMPNFAFHHIARAVRPRAAGGRLDSVEMMVNCSEPCKPAAFDAFLDRWRANGVEADRLGCCYAMAETVFALTQTRPGHIARRLRVDGETFGVQGAAVRAVEDGGHAMLSCGPALDGVELRILDGSGRQLGEDRYGEIVVRAPFLFDGYFKDPARTALSMTPDGFYRTRDVGFLRDGELFVCGRLDDMIIVSGRNLYAHEIEALVGGVDGVTPGRAVAFSVHKDEAGSDALIVVAESQRSDAGDRSAIALAIAEAINDTVGVAPADIVLLAPKTIHKTTSGKVDRKANRSAYIRGTLAAWHDPALQEST